MSKKIGRNDLCPCGSGKKYKNCHMLLDQEATAAKYTPSGKRKFKAKVLTLEDRSLSVFGRSAISPQSQPATTPGVLERLKFRMTQNDFSVKKEEMEESQLPFNISPAVSSEEQPQARVRNLPQPGEAFKVSDEDFREKKE